MRFTYVGMETGGGAVEGFVEADSEQAALRKLAADGLVISQLEAVSRSSSKARRARRASLNQLAEAFQELSTTLDGGVKLNEAVAGVAASSPHKPVQATFANIQARLRDGAAFSAALEEEAPEVPRAMVVLIRAGEASGDMSGAMRGVVESLQTQSALRREVINALIYPALLSVAGLCAVLFILMTVVPRFARALGDRVEELPTLSRVMFGMSEALTGNVVIVFVVAIALAAGIVQLARSRALRQRLFDAALSLPVAGTWLSASEAARWSALMAALAARKVPLLDALELSRQSLTSARFQRQLRLVERAVRRGQALGRSLADLTMFPRSLANLASAGESAGDLSAAMAAAARMYEAQVKTHSKRFLTLLEPLMILLISIFVALIAVAMVSAISSVNQTPL